MGSVAERRRLSSISFGTPLDRWVGKGPRLYRAIRQRARYKNMVDLRSLDSNRQAGPLCKRPVYKEAVRALRSLQHAEGQGVPYIPLKSRTRQNNTLDPEVTSKTPEGRSATFRVQGSVFDVSCFFLVFFFFFHFSFFFFFLRKSFSFIFVFFFDFVIFSLFFFHFPRFLHAFLFIFFFLVFCVRFYSFFQFFFLGSLHSGRSKVTRVTVGRDTNQSIRVCKVNLATMKVATNSLNG